MTIKSTMIAAVAGAALLFSGAALAAGQGHGHNQMGQNAGQGTTMTVPDASTCNCKDGTCPMLQGGACNCKDGTCPMNADGTCPHGGGKGHHGAMQHDCKGGTCPKNADGTCPHGGHAGHMGGKHGGQMCGNKHGSHHGGGAMSAMAFTLDDARSVLDQKIQLQKDANLKIGSVTQVDDAFIRGTIVDADGKVVADYIFAVATGDWTKVN